MVELPVSVHGAPAPLATSTESGSSSGALLLALAAFVIGLLITGSGVAFATRRWRR